MRMGNICWRHFGEGGHVTTPVSSAPRMLAQAKKAAALFLAITEMRGVA